MNGRTARERDALPPVRKEIRRKMKGEYLVTEKDKGSAEERDRGWSPVGGSEEVGRNRGAARVREKRRARVLEGGDDGSNVGGRGDNRNRVEAEGRLAGLSVGEGCKEYSVREGVREEEGRINEERERGGREIERERE